LLYIKNTFNLGFIHSQTYIEYSKFILQSLCESFERLSEFWVSRLSMEAQKSHRFPWI